MSLVERIQDLCSSKNTTPIGLERELGLGRGTIRNWDKNSPSVDKIQKVAEYFNVTVEYLIGKTAFKNPTELFEYWSGHNNPEFESPFDFGGLLREVREEQGVTQSEVGKSLGITESDVDDIEDGMLPINYEWAEKYANFLGTSVQQIFIDNDMDDSLNDIPLERLRHYQDQGMSKNEIIQAESEFREAELNDVLSEPQPKDDMQLAFFGGPDKYTEDEIKIMEDAVRSYREQKKRLMEQMQKDNQK